MHFPLLCGLKALRLKAPKPPVKGPVRDVATHNPLAAEPQLMRQQVNLRTLKTLIRQTVEEVEGAEIVKRAFNG